MTFTQLLSAVGLAPKDLESARNVIEPAKATLESVNTLFSNAGLNLEQMLEAGPDSLKAHIESLGQSDEDLAESLERTEALVIEAGDLRAKVGNVTNALAAAGITIKDAANADEVKAALADHVKKSAAVELAKAGHPPVPVAQASGSAVTDSDIYAEYKSMPPGAARLAFYAKHETALRRAAGFRD